VSRVAIGRNGKPASRIDCATRLLACRIYTTNPRGKPPCDAAIRVSARSKRRAILHDPGDIQTETTLDFEQRLSAASVLRAVVQKRGDRLILVSPVFDHRRCVVETGRQRHAFSC